MLIGVEHETSFLSSGPAFIDGLADTSTCIYGVHLLSGCIWLETS